VEKTARLNGRDNNFCKVELQGQQLLQGRLAGQQIHKVEWQGQQIHKVE
jgi:hypothetical protein